MWFNARNPMIGPGARKRNKYPGLITGSRKLISSMLTTVIENPIQVTIVKAVPFDAAGAYWATIVENIGESAITNKPQKIRKGINRCTGM